MKRVKTLTGNKTYGTTMCKGGCGECQTSCQSACKTTRLARVINNQRAQQEERFLIYA